MEEACGPFWYAPCWILEAEGEEFLVVDDADFRSEAVESPRIEPGQCVEWLGPMFAFLDEDRAFNGGTGVAAPGAFTPYFLLSGGFSLVRGSTPESGWYRVLDEDSGAYLAPEQAHDVSP